MSAIIIRVKFDGEERLMLKYQPSLAITFEYVKNCLINEYGEIHLSIQRNSDEETIGPESILPPGEYTCICNKVHINPQVFVVAGVIKFGKLRWDCRQTLYRIAEENHAKTRVGTADDGISYQGITQHLQFKLIFEEKSQAEEFIIAVKKIPLEYNNIKHVELPSGDVVFPDIIVAFQRTQRADWDGDLDRVFVEEDYDESSYEDDVDTDSVATAVSVNAETRLRLLEKENSPNLFRLNPVKCRIVRKFDGPAIINNANNIVYMSSSLHDQLDAIASTEGIPQFYFRYFAHNEQDQQGLLDNKPTRVYETTVEVVFKDEEAKNELSLYFKDAMPVNETTIRVVACFPNPLEFEYFARTKAEETLARWACYDGNVMLNV